jgi:hypothetical protein
MLQLFRGRPQKVLGVVAGRDQALDDVCRFAPGKAHPVAGGGLGLAVPVNATTRQIVGSLMREGRVQESNFHDYRVLRMDEMPRIEVHIVPSTGKMGGAGEPGTPPIAPAVANAVFALTGQRLRDLPLRLAAAETA